MDIAWALAKQEFSKSVHSQGKKAETLQWAKDVVNATFTEDMPGVSDSTVPKPDAGIGG